MFLATTDICWVTHTAGMPFEEDLKTLEAISDGSMSSYVLAIMGKRPAKMPTPPKTVTVRYVGEPSLSLDELADAELPIARVKQFTSLIDRWEPGLPLDTEAAMFMELAQLLIHCGHGFRQALLWRQPEILSAMKRFHQRCPLGETTTETIFVTNDLLEVLMKIVAVSRQLPEAKIYHSVRGSYSGFVAALAAIRHGGSLVCSEELSQHNTKATFWLKVFPHHWNDSLSNSHIYQTVGEHSLTLVRYLINSIASKVLIPYPVERTNERDQMAYPSVTIHDSFDPQTTSSSTVIGWLVDTLSEPCLESLGQTCRHLSDLKDQVEVKVIEAAPGKCTQMADMSRWLNEHRDADRLLSGVVPYQTGETNGAKLLVHAATNTSNSDHLAGEETAWILMRSLASGVPILTSPRLSGVLGQDSEARKLMTTSNDPKDIAKAIRAFVTEPEMQPTMSSAALALAQAQFSPEQVVETHIDVYNNLLSSGTRRRSSKRKPKPEASSVTSKA